MHKAMASFLLLLLAGCASSEPTRPATTDVPSHSVTFATSDGVTLSGQLFGAGSTAVVLSNMGDNDPAAWERFAPLLASRGYLVLTYSYRYPLRTNHFTAAMAQGSVPDLQAAIAFVRAQGASKLVLMGASLGADATAKVAGSGGAAAVVLLAGELEVVGYDFSITDTELAAMTAPKLFVASKEDTITPYADSQALYARVPEPKQFTSYPGSAHGVRLFDTADSDSLRERLIGFVTTNAPA